MPAIGAKECIFNLNLAFLDPGDVALAADPGYPVYTGGPLLAGAEPVLMPLVPSSASSPTWTRSMRPHAHEPGCCSSTTPTTRPGRSCRTASSSVVRFGADNDILIVHDNAYSETTYDGYVAPSFLATPGAKDVGVEVFSLSKGYNMTGWRCAAIVGNAQAIASYWRLKTNVDSGLFEAVQLAGAAALSPQLDHFKAEMNRIYERRRDLVCDALAGIGVEVTRPRGTIYIWAPGARRLRERRGLLRARARAGGGGALAWRRLRAQRRGLLPHLADDARRSSRRGGRATRQARRVTGTTRARVARPAGVCGGRSRKLAGPIARSRGFAPPVRDD
jgi:aspartate/methionine/tyrosine aminotransferase